MTKAWQSRYPALRSWKLRNFKSVVNTDIDFAPLTLIVGANSAGKSSLLQSILMMAQASSEETPGGFPLNGPLVGLGAFEEARTDFEPRDGDQISIGAQIAIPPMLRRYSFYSPRLFMLGMSVDDPADADQAVQTLDWEVTLSKDPESNGAVVGQSQVVLGQGEAVLGSLSAYPRPKGEQSPPMLAGNESRYGEGYKLDQHLDDGFEDSPYGARRRRSPRQADRQYDAVVFKAGVPVDALCVMSEAELFLQALDEFALDVRPRNLVRERRETGVNVPLFTTDVEPGADHLSALLSAPFARFVEVLRSESKMDFNVDEQIATEYGQAMRSESVAKSLRPALLETLTETVGGERSILAHLYEDTVRAIATIIPQYFSEGVLYLGPLREDPRVTYPHSIAGSTHMPLGRKGESTASVLLQSQSGGRSPARAGSGRYPLPSGVNTSSLVESVRAWVKKFELGQTLRVTDENRYGVAFKIDRRDLTSVGTGVSQILPVIVLCLMAQPGQVTLLEQPELHLNPALQQHLADFFLAMVKTGRQLIVETHSEYVITRLRRRVAEDDKDHVRRLFNIVFAEMDRDHHTRFRVIDVDEAGALGVDEWPTGFFDHAGHDVEAMMRHAMARRHGVRVAPDQ
ncbi:AAA family ATPase [Mycolicibacterium septicum]|nr:AAA family ATPase [Mycolicibacterium septicum]